MNKDQAAALRAEFPPEQIGKLPKAGITLSYVGHASVTDRLLQVDPEWTWKPKGCDEHGNPVLIANEGGMAGEPFGLWIELTVCGVTRPGFGGGKNAKECISDAIRNAAMRFGVALDLWAKEDLHSTGPADSPSSAAASPYRAPASAGGGGAGASDAQKKKLHALFKDAGLTDEQFKQASKGKTIEQLSKAEATDLISRLVTYTENLYAENLKKDAA